MSDLNNSHIVIPTSELQTTLEYALSPLMRELKEIKCLLREKQKKQFLTYKEAAEICDCHPNTIGNHVRAGNLKRMATNQRLKREDVEHFEKSDYIKGRKRIKNPVIS